MNSRERPAALSAVGLSRTFPGTVPVRALIDATFRVEYETFTALVGRSGSGKSTLLMLLGLLDRPSSGQMSLAGHDVSELTEVERRLIRRDRIGFVFQSFHLVREQTAIANVELALRYAGVKRSQRHRLAKEALVEVGLGHRVDALCSTLSGGEMQRVSIARALVKLPDIILADEPTGNLDSQTEQEILDLFRLISSAGTAVIAVTHSHDVAAQADRRLVMLDGVVSEGGHDA